MNGKKLKKVKGYASTAFCRSDDPERRCLFWKNPCPAPGLGRIIGMSPIVTLVSTISWGKLCAPLSRCRVREQLHHTLAFFSELFVSLRDSDGTWPLHYFVGNFMRASSARWADAESRIDFHRSKAESLPSCSVVELSYRIIQATGCVRLQLKYYKAQLSNIPFGEEVHSPKPVCVHCLRCCSPYYPFQSVVS